MVWCRVRGKMLTLGVLEHHAAATNLVPGKLLQQIGVAKGVVGVVVALGEGGAGGELNDRVTFFFLWMSERASERGFRSP